MSSNFYINDLRSGDRNALLALMESGTDYPYWYRNGQSRAAAADEYISYVKAAEDGKTQDRFKAIHEEGTNKLVGVIVLVGYNSTGNGDAEIGYFIHQDYQKRGIGMQAAFRVVQDAVTNAGLATLYTTVHPKKVESLKILLNLGMRVTGYGETSIYTEPDGSPAQRIFMKGKEGDVRAALERLAERYDSPVPNRPGAPEPSIMRWDI